MSAPSVPSPHRSYSDAMWNTYITDAIQSGNHIQYCTQHNIPYTTFRKKHRQYKQPVQVNQYQLRSRENNQ